MRQQDNNAFFVEEMERIDMEDGLNFNVEGLEELERDLKKAVKKYPATMQEGLKSIAKDFKKSVKKRTPDGKNHKGDAVTKLRKNYHIKMQDDGLISEAVVYNDAPHAHLVEDGHQLVKGGKLSKGGHVIGFVQGKHMMEKTRNEYKDIVPERFEKMIDDILKESDLN